MLLIERPQLNLPLVFGFEVGRSTVDYSEYWRAVESSQQVVDDADAVVIDLGRAQEENVTSVYSNQEPITFAQNLLADMEPGSYDLGSSTTPLESYQFANRLHRFPVFGSLIIDIYI